VYTVCVGYRGPLSCVDKGFKIFLPNLVIGMGQFVPTGGSRFCVRAVRGLSRLYWVEHYSFYRFPNVRSIVVKTKEVVLCVMNFCINFTRVITVQECFLFVKTPALDTTARAEACRISETL
jgi:hypothetical protein